MEKLVRAEKLRKYYHRDGQIIKALDQITVSMAKGSFTVVTGPSGSGKSTLLHMLSFQEKPTEGIVILDGISSFGKSERELSRVRREKVSFVNQNCALMPEYTVYENIIMPVILEKKRVDEAYIGEVMESLGIAGLSRVFPGEISGGEKQRVAIARALANRPAVIFADEPTAQLDSENSRLVVKLLRASGEYWNQTIVMATHDMEVAQYGDAILYLRNGRLKTGGETGENGRS
ncbi:ABC transporter ATP-binding protein [Anaerolentibacter hominis]|uniref:ABC transporter ATP-binding protein n=1 Tax=Anaerolentibacter hominis TaxID=3079009 RepID=UPI0031B81DA3